MFFIDPYNEPTIEFSEIGGNASDNASLVAYIAAQIAAINNYLARTTTEVTHTGDTNNTKVYSRQIAAGAVTNGDILQMVARVNKAGSNGTFTVRIYFNTSDSLSGATLVAVRDSGASNFNNFLQLSRYFVVRSSTTEVYSTSSTNQSDDNVVTNFGPQDVLIDWSVIQYFIVAVQLTNTSDTVELGMAFLKK